MGNAAQDTLPGLLDELSRERGDAPALLCGADRISYAQLRTRAAALARGLTDLGVGPGERVAVWLPNDPAWVELEFALARVGAIAVAVNTRFRAHEVQDIVGRSGARVLVLAPGFAGIDFLSIVAGLDLASLPRLEMLVLVGEPGSATSSPPGGLRGVPYEDLVRARPLDESAARPDTPCNVFTSSGTTAAPKLVLHTQGAVARHVRAVAGAFGYTEPGSAVLCALPCCGVFGFDTLLAALAAGAPAVLMPVFDGAEAVRLIEARRVTHLNGADEMLRRILAAAEPVTRIASLRSCGFASWSGDPRALVDAGDAAGVTFFQTYGSSEVQALTAVQTAAAGPARRALGGGTPVSAAMDVRVRDPASGRLLARGETGMLEIHGPSVLAGYLGDAAAAEDTFTSDGYVRTGDLGYLTDDGFVYLSRLGDALRLGGFLVDPREIEEFIERLPGVAAAQVVGVPLDTGTVPVAFVVADAAGPVDADRLLGLCRERLARFKVPRRIVELDRFPTTASPNGEKVQRVRLRELATELLDR